MAIRGNEKSLLAFQITFEITNVEAKIKEPKRAPQEIKAPSVLFDAADEVRMSGAPLANAMRVTAANVGDSPNRSAKSYIPVAKNLSAIVAIHMKRMG